MARIRAHALAATALLLLATATVQAQNCTELPDSSSCDDGNFTSVGDRCVAGECVGCEPTGEPCIGRYEDCVCLKRCDQPTLQEYTQFVTAGACEGYVEGDTCELECVPGNDKYDTVVATCQDGQYVGLREMDCARDRAKISTELGNMNIHLEKSRDLNIQIDDDVVSFRGVVQNVKDLDARNEQYHTDAEAALDNAMEQVDTEFEEMTGTINQLSQTVNDNQVKMESAISSLGQTMSRDLSEAAARLEQADRDINQAVAGVREAGAVNAQNIAGNKALAQSGVSKAGAAQSTANTALSKANSAQSTANSGVTKANAAASTANSALSKANSALSKANSAVSGLNSVYDSIRSVCSAVGGTFSNNKCTIPPCTESNPGSSCKDCKAQGMKTGGMWVKHPQHSTPHRVYCDMTNSGGGWELLHKIDGNSGHFSYDSGYWGNTNVYRETVMNGNWGENVKGWGYNFGQYREIQLRWRDPHDGAQWTWTTPGGWQTSWTPQRYFNTGRHLCCSRSSEVRNQQMWTSAGNRFSNQGCAGSTRVAQCTSGAGCARWGFHWNNECGYGSNDAGGGWGIRHIRGSAASAGDWVTCCQWYTGRRRDFDANMYGRV